MIEVAIVGRGTIGVATLLKFMSYCKNEPIPMYLTMSYDPNIPVTKVGETTTFKIVDLLEDLFGEEQTKDILKECGATTRKGTEFTWLNNPERNFNIDYGSIGVHFDSEKFCDTVIEYIQKDYPEVEFLHKNWGEGRIIIPENEKRNIDLLIDCRGTPSKGDAVWSNDYVLPNFTSVNSVLIYQDEVETKEEEQYTGNVFHDMGWMFKIPLKHRTAYGFLYNNQINTKEEAKKHFEEIVPQIKDKKLVEFSWEYYYRKRALQDRVLYMGNRLFFFEPAQAIPIHFYLRFLDYILKEYHWNNRLQYDLAEGWVNKVYMDFLDSVYCLTAFNYAGDMEIDSEFWNTKREEAKEVLKNSSHYEKQLLEYQEGRTEFLELFTHSSDLMKKYADGLKIQVPKEKENEQ